MDIGILSVRDKEYYPNRRFMESGPEMGHRVALINPYNCLIGTGKPGLAWESLHENFSLQVVIPRIGARIGEYSLAIVRHFELTGIRVINMSGAILTAKNKFLSLQVLSNHGVSVPGTYLASTWEAFEQAVVRLGGYPVVVKVPSGRQGTGVVLVESSVTGEFILNNLPVFAQSVLVQKFFPPDHRRDIRVFVLGRKVLGAMELTPKDGDFRSNIHLKGRARSIRLPEEMKALALEATGSLGLDIAGIDIIQDAQGHSWVIEVNYSPGFQGFEAVLKIDAASEIIRYSTQNHGSIL